jgi:three-Cys-motif partner protein
VTDPYLGREQTQAKHFILRRYLQALAFKVLTFQDITYVDGFSGPWETKATSFADSSFMIAIEVLKDAQKQCFERRGHKRRIRCFFSEDEPEAFKQLEAAVRPYDNLTDGFEVKTYLGKFEDAVTEIQEYIGDSFPLIFIDPTGWTGYPFEKIKPLFARRKCEVLINFMYSFVQRFVYSDDPGIIASLDPILGGPGWRDRLQKTMDRGSAVERLFRETLKNVGNFDFVVSTKIDKSTQDRPHFIITYGTKSPDGLKVFRQTEFDALRLHERNRANAKEKLREDRTHTADLFAGHQAAIQEATIDELVAEQMQLASKALLELLSEHGGSLTFKEVVVVLLQAFMLREKNVKDVCVALEKQGKIQNTWGGGNRKPKDECTIKLRNIR